MTFCKQEVKIISNARCLDIIHLLSSDQLPESTSTKLSVDDYTAINFTEFAVVVACQKMADLYLSCLMCFNLGTIRIYTCALKEREGKFKET